MSCAYNSNLVAKICCRSGISGSVARGAFYLGTTLAVSGGTAALAYWGLKTSSRKTDREVFAALADIQMAAAKGRVALAPDTPGDVREGLLSSAGEQLLEAVRRVEKLPAGNPFRMDCAVQVKRLAKAIGGAIEVLREPGDIVKTERIQSIFRSAQYAMLYPPETNGRLRGKALLIGGAAGITILGAMGLIERKRRQAAQQTPSPRITEPMRTESSSLAKAEEQVAKMEGQTIKIAQVDWKRRKALDGGGYAMVYEIAPGVVAKVGEIKPNEAWMQQYYAEKKRALPVFDYQPEVELPTAVSKECCPVHGLRREILPDHGYACTCGKPQAVLLMPKAELPEDLKSEAVRAFMMGFAQECDREFDFYWDSRPKNVARYEGQWVALDFGEEFEGVQRAPVGWKPPGMISQANTD